MRSEDGKEALQKAPSIIKDLIERYERNESEYKGKGYNEFQLRNEFINPFFAALGWDIENKKGAAPAYRDVLLEDSIKIGGGTKAPDYCFTLSGRRKFFVETKKPSIKVKKDAKSAFQLRRYAWSSKLTLSILTNFEEFVIYEARQRPHAGDNPDVERIKSISYKEYIDKWDDIYSIFSYEAALQGSFDKYAETARKKRGTREVDDEFLKEIEEWREKLAKNIAIRNPDLSVRELNHSVQRTIDRIIFLRMCEDKGIEKFDQLQSIAGKDNIYSNLCEIFKKADEKYNSGLFHFKKERNRNTLPDELTLKINIEDNVLKNIFRHLYYPNSPYEFSVISPEILGNVYEQFLGKIIRLTEGHRAKIEEKPEVKKAGGVYYTPQYIVDYVVENTVGSLIKDKSPKQISNLKVLDPACGSGSFLIGAYSKLLQYHLDYYSGKKNPKIYKDQIYQGKEGEWNLTIKEKKRILLNNVFGVDIDSQAVEVTKLSLLLKVLEGESRDVFEKQQKLWRERALPDLSNNIKCGNSLIEPDFYKGGLQTTLFDDNEMYRINAFDWNEEFKEIMKSGRFDAVIGNPPYIRIQRMAHDEIDYFFSNFESAGKKIDISVLFLEKSLELLNENGFAGFISTSQWTSTDYGEGIRGILSRGFIQKMVDFGSLPVFHKVSTYPAIFIISKKMKKNLEYIKINSKELLNLIGINSQKSMKISYDTLSKDRWILGEFDLERWIKQKNIKTEKLSSYGHFYIGALTGMDNVFVLTKQEFEKLDLENELAIPYAYRGEEIEKYSNVYPNSVIIYPYKSNDKGDSILIEEDELKKYPNIYKYLLKYKDSMTKRKDSRKYYAQGKNWYRYLRQGRFFYIRPEKLIIKGVAKESCVGLLSNNIAFNGANCPAFILEKGDIHYLLAILNSKLISQHLRAVCPAKLQDYRRFNANNLNDIPIRSINFSNNTEKKIHDDIVKFIKQIIALKKNVVKTATPHQKEIIRRQIDYTDHQINRLIFELYGLSEEEVKMI